jgi:hypothetical protein
MFSRLCKPRCVAAVEQVRHGAEQIAEEVARSRHRRDVQVHLVQRHHEPEQIEVQRPEGEVENLAAGSACGRRDDRRERRVREVRHRAGGVGERSGDGAVRDQLARAVEREARDRGDAREGAARVRRSRDRCRQRGRRICRGGGSCRESEHRHKRGERAGESESDSHQGPPYLRATKYPRSVFDLLGSEEIPCDRDAKHGSGGASIHSSRLFLAGRKPQRRAPLVRVDAVSARNRRYHAAHAILG